MKNSKKSQIKKIDPTPSTEDVLRNQINLYQYCNDMSNKLRDLENQVSNMSYQMHMIKRDNFDLKNLLQGLGNHLKMMHEREMGEHFDMGQPEPRNSNPSPSPQDKNPMLKKSLPLHDDVMLNCEVCNNNHHVNMKMCPKCGFERAKKDR